MSTPRNVIVITGVRGMGLAIARRVGSGAHIILADFSPENLETATRQLQDEGHSVEKVQTDVSDKEALAHLAQHAAQAGPISLIAHTAGLSPTQATAERIYNVDLLGTALVIDAFYPVASAGTSLVIIASIAGHMTTGAISPALETHLALAPTEGLLTHPELKIQGDQDIADPKDVQKARGLAYGIAKRGNHVRVQAAAKAWAAKGARINTISPGLISTPMGVAEMNSPTAENVRGMIAMSASGRIGTPSDVANVVAFLASPEASFIVGNDISVDGGFVAASRWEQRG